MEKKIERKVPVKTVPDQDLFETEQPKESIQTQEVQKIKEHLKEEDNPKPVPFVEHNPMSSEIPIPSKGCFYEGGESVFYLRPMEVAEERIMSTARLVRSGEALNRLLSSCITEPKMNINDLLIADKSHLIIKLRQLSYGDEYNFEVKCPACGRKYNDYVKLSELPTTFLPDGTVPEDLQVFLERCGKTVAFRLLTGHDEIKIKQKQTNRVKYGSARDMLDESYIDRLMLSIVSVDGEHLSEKDLHEFVEHLPVIDSEKLRDKIEEYSAGIDIEIDSPCPYQDCENENVMMMPIDANFFRANRKSKRKRS